MELVRCILKYFSIHKQCGILNIKCPCVSESGLPYMDISRIGTEDSFNSCKYDKNNTSTQKVGDVKIFVVGNHWPLFNKLKKAKCYSRGQAKQNMIVPPNYTVFITDYVDQRLGNLCRFENKGMLVIQGYIPPMDIKNYDYLLIDNASNRATEIASVYTIHDIRADKYYHYF
jgi:hypothetical protein